MTLYECTHARRVHGARYAMSAHDFAALFSAEAEVVYFEEMQAIESRNYHMVRL